VLVQVMSGEKPFGRQTETTGDVRKLPSLGQAPILMRELAGAVKFKRHAAGTCLTPPAAIGLATAEPPPGHLRTVLAQLGNPLSRFALAV